MARVRPERIGARADDHHTKRRAVRNPRDGKPRSYRDIKAVAIASAEFLKSKRPNSAVAVKNLKTGEIAPVLFKPV